MNIFANYLSGYLEEKKYSKRKAAEMIRIDRTQLRRYIAGERLPKDEKIVEYIATGLCMTGEEQSVLMSYYKRSLMGEQKYAWYRTINTVVKGEIAEFLREKIETDGMIYHSDKSCDCIHHTDEPDTLQSFYEIIRKIREICTEAVYIKGVLITQFYDYYQTIEDSVRDNDTLEIQLLIHLNSLYDVQDISDIRAFQNVYQVMEKGKNCEIYYAYHSVELTVDYNFVMTNKGIVVFSSFSKDRKNAMGFYTRKKEIHSYFLNKYKRMLVNSKLYGCSGNKFVTLHQSDQQEDKKKFLFKDELEVYEKNGIRGIHFYKQDFGRDVYIEEYHLVAVFEDFFNQYGIVNNNEFQIKNMEC